MSFEFKSTSFIGNSRGSETGKTFTAFSPETGEAVGPEFHSATIVEMNRAANLAENAFGELSRKSGKEKAEFLRRIAEKLEEKKADIVERASLETGLPKARFEGETGRTCGQLRMFADLAQEGSWVDARIDTAETERAPLPKPDVRSMKRALGPVAVFCASNFPIAFSVAGGDTASAFAAGSPVIVNAHNAHPGTSEIAASAISEAVNECGFPEGTFSLLFSADYEIGSALVAHPSIKAVGFTGSRAGGRALMDIAAKRDEPIPVYAEMSSVNPVFVLPRAAEEKADSIAEGLFSSFTLGYGQFCTKPGLAFLPGNGGYGAIVSRLNQLSRESSGKPLLTSGIRNSFIEKISERGAAQAAAKGYAVESVVFETSVGEFRSTPELHEEVFGPSTLAISFGEVAELVDIAEDLEGQLTATIHGTDEDIAEAEELIAVLEKKVGRIVFNGFPTGVEVCHSMVHGGPYPATSFSGTTSVGTRAIERFTKLVCFQDAPDSVLPDELKDGNPLGIVRMKDGVIGRT
ncbi:MAG: aldehyde dehydrogenase (NADP(+)) [Acidobacteria bacterium]|nr:MAG: aldehyde dehydrogenase (NADP(+)) [Acidobacteriota bacterium]REK02419.1 MAG: aldehyde dehydrogenase (NADP(+)) [Acidobacteriota bacterium]REK13780.1 MAG: aldehyde dehydrogenase (NADP(+)) [Acidobacteriota bacterium]REK41774.1 MAG: aldehyde dehydrogenase (NADP(+)) [Acidobacteriota bacterium]